MIKKILYGAILAATLMVGVAQPVWAEESKLCQDYKNDPDLYAAAGCNKADVTASDFANNLFTVIISLVGVIGIGVMVYGGIMYTTSTGDAAKVQRAKHVIMYGIIGMAVALLAYAIVFFITKAVNGV